MDEELFRYAVSRLRGAGIHFWIDSGTLLGMVREGQPISWDTDYDFGVWLHETTEATVLEAFDPRSHRIVSLFPWSPAVHIHPLTEGARGKIDVGFYTREAGLAVYRAQVPPDGLWTRLLQSIERFFNPRIKGDKAYKRWSEALFRGFVLPLTPGFVRRSFRRAFQHCWKRNISKGPCFVYEYPAHYLDRLKTAAFLGVEVDIPEDAEGYLEAAYGVDWRTPRKYANWYDGASRRETGSIASQPLRSGR